MTNKNKYLLISRRLARQLYYGQITPAHLDQALILQTFFDLKQATEQNLEKSVFSNDFEKCVQVLLLHRFLFRFATAKTYTQLYHMNKRLFNADKQRSWNDFKKEAEKIDRSFNGHNLKFECQKLIHNSAFWNEQHPYFIRVTAGPKKVKQAVEKSKTFAPYFTAYRFNNNSVEVSPFADQSDLKENYGVAKILVDNGISLKIRPHILLPRVKNPEYEIEGKLGELKTLHGKNISSHIRAAASQGAKIVVFQMREYPYDSNRLRNQTIGLVSLYRKGTFDKFIIIKPDKTIEVFEVSKFGK